MRNPGAGLLAFCRTEKAVAAFGYSASTAYAGPPAWHASCECKFVMKNLTLETTVVGIVLVAAWAAPAMVHAEKSFFSAGVTNVAAENGKILDGKITERTADGITVAGYTLVVNSATAITTKGGEKAKLDDLKVGDRVRVIIAKATDGNVVALSIEVGAAT